MNEPDLHRDLEAVAAALGAAERVVVASHENPDGDAIGSIIAAGHAHPPAGQAGAQLPARRLADPARVRLSGPGLDRAHARPGLGVGLDAARAGLRQRAPAGPRPRGPAGRLRHGRGHRPPPRQQPLRRGQPGRRPRLLDRRDPQPTCSTRWVCRSRPRSPRRSTSAWSPTPAASSTAPPARPRCGWRAAAGRWGGRAQGLRADLRVGAVGQAAAAGARARERPHVRRRPRAGQPRDRARTSRWWPATRPPPKA